MSIRVENIVKRYGEQLALNDVSFEIGDGEIVGFLGPNGAGKSTMMKILTGYLAATSGTATIGGLNVNTDPIAVKQQIGYLPEHNPLYLDMYVKEYLSYVAGIYNVANPKMAVESVVEQVGLQSEFSKKIGALSKGYRQRVGLAQVLVHDPSVLILDEPTTGLDPNQIEEIRQVIIEVGKQKTVMMSTHIMQEVEAVCSRTLILNKGKLVADDTATTKNAQDSGQKAFIVEYSGEVSAEALEKLLDVKAVVLLKGTTWKVYSNHRKDVRNDLFQFALDHDVSVLTLKEDQQKMEDVFKRLTKD